MVQRSRALLTLARGLRGTIVMAQYWVSHSRNHGVNTHISTGEMQARPDGFTDNGGFHVHSGHCHLESGLMNIQKECTCHLALFLVRSSGGCCSTDDPGHL